MDGLKIEFKSREIQKSEYDWANLYYDEVGVGKARCLIEGDEFTIFSINIYPEFQGKGYGKEFIKLVKRSYATIVANRVRFNAIGFWEAMDFVRDGDTSNWVYKPGT